MSSNSTNPWLKIMEEHERIERAIGIFLFCFFSFNNLATVLSLIFLLVKKPYPKKVLRWFAVQAVADSLLILNWVYTVLAARSSSFPELTNTAAMGFLNIFSFDEPAVDLKCKARQFLPHLPLFLSPMNLAFSSSCRCVSISFPLKAKNWITNRVNNALLAGSFLLAVALTLSDSLSYILKPYKTLPEYACCKLDFKFCTLPSISRTVWWEFAVNCKLITMLTLYTVCLLTSLILIYNLISARRHRSNMTAGDGGNKQQAAENRVALMLVLSSILQFICSVPGEMSALRMFPFSDPYTSTDFRQARHINNFLWDMTKMNNAVNWIFYSGMMKDFYLFLLPCVRKRTAASRLTGSASGAATRSDG